MDFGIASLKLNVCEGRRTCTGDVTGSAKCFEATCRSRRANLQDLPMSLAITRLSPRRSRQYVHLMCLIEYYCSMGILKIWSRLAKAVHCIHAVELFIRGPVHLSLNGISY